MTHYSIFNGSQMTILSQVGIFFPMAKLTIKLIKYLLESPILQEGLIYYQKVDPPELMSHNIFSYPLNMRPILL